MFLLRPRLRFPGLVLAGLGSVHHPHCVQLGIAQAFACAEEAVRTRRRVGSERLHPTSTRIFAQLLVSTATPMALLLANTSSESKITRPNGLLFPYQLREKIDLYLSQ